MSLQTGMSTSNVDSLLIVALVTELFSVTFTVNSQVTPLVNRLLRPELQSHKEVILTQF